MKKQFEVDKKGNITLDMYYRQEGVTKPTLFIHPDNLADYLPTNIKETLTEKYYWAKKQVDDIENDKRRSMALNKDVKKELARWSKDKQRDVPSDGILQLFENYQIPMLEKQLTKQPNDKKRVELLERMLGHINDRKIMDGIMHEKISRTPEGQLEKEYPFEEKKLPSFLDDYKRYAETKLKELRLILNPFEPMEKAGWENTVQGPHSDKKNSQSHQTLKDIFVEDDAYTNIIGKLIEEGLIDKDTHYWTDKSVGHKGKIVALLNDLFYKKYFKVTQMPFPETFIDVAKSTFGVEISKRMFHSEKIPELRKEHFYFIEKYQPD